jgi:carboxyl-terminal processing protease
MGQRSFGKGLVQRYRELTYGTQLKVTISKYYTPSGRCIQELDYANRDPKTGEVPKFSDKGINEFKTENGRTVYDGGGVLPDVVLERSKQTAATKKLIASSAIFNFATEYYYQNTELKSTEEFSFSKSDFKDFQNFLKKDTVFVTHEEQLFKKAFTSLKKNEEKTLSKQYKQIKETLIENKIDEISKNKALIEVLLKEEILKRYFYKEGVYKYKLKQDKVVLKAVELLKNEKQFQQLLTAN